MMNDKNNTFVTRKIECTPEEWEHFCERIKEYCERQCSLTSSDKNVGVLSKEWNLEMLEIIKLEELEDST